MTRGDGGRGAGYDMRRGGPSLVSLDGLVTSVAAVSLYLFIFFNFHPALHHPHRRNGQRLLFIDKIKFE